MRVSPDELIFWQYGFIHINYTLLTTWVLMAVMAASSFLVTRKIRKRLVVSHWQSMLEIIVLGIQQQLNEVGLKQNRKYLPFLGTLFLFIAVSNLFTIVPFYEPPTGSLSTTAALAISVFTAVPVFGISGKGIKNYLKEYIQPTFIMLPFHLVSEVSRTLALAVRLFGNMMSGTMIISILLSITPFFFPVVMTLLGLLTGMVQAYIFTILATVYIAAAAQEEEPASSLNK